MTRTSDLRPPASKVTAADFLPESINLASLRAAARTCRGCRLYRDATQTVFGEGLKRSRLMLVGEQPGDEEDVKGRPFVGPSGRLLDRALGEAGIARDDAYVTNVVKHFNFEMRGEKRLHKTPNTTEVVSCYPWLEKEIEVVRPHVLMCLGATASRALLGAAFRVSRQRGQLIESELAPYVTATIHPSAILRIKESDERRAEFERLVDELVVVRGVLDGGDGS